MSSLTDLLNRIKSLDPNGTLDGKSYGLSYNESLGFKDAGLKDFHVGIPYDPWPADIKFAKADFESALAVAFKDTVRTGLNASSQKDGDRILIDITSLAGSWQSFFLWRDKDTSGNSEHSVAKEFGKLINSLPVKTTPIIRILLGQVNPKGVDDVWENGLRGEIEDIFWHGNTPTITHAKAEIHVGYYSPSFDAKLNSETFAKSEKGLNSLVEAVRAIPEGILSILPEGPNKKKLETLLATLTTKEAIQFLAKTQLPSISWNHAKLVAVNGQTLMTGGGIYYPLYTDNEATVHDLQCKVKGEAAISAHSYCDYFWQYLNRDHKTDKHSFRRHRRAAAANSEAWDKVAAPEFDKKPTAQPTGKNLTPVLTVAKLGDWVGDMKDLEYPVQIIDGIRDLLLNLFFRKMWVAAKNNSDRSEIYYFPGFLGIVNDRLLNPKFMKGGVTSAAWASRIARCTAIENAQTQVYIDTEAIASFLHTNEAAWSEKNTKTGKTMIEQINDYAELGGKDAWDGVLWPYDLIYALYNFMNHVSDPGNGTNGVFIILSSPRWQTSPERNNATHKGWEDEVAVKELKQRIRVFASMTTDPDEIFNAWFDARCHIKRISNDGTRFNHCKVVCTDMKLLYVGSDNTYPNYNEEHGIWIEDKIAIGDWYDKYWKLRWNNVCVAIEPDKENKKFAPTMD